MNKEERVILVDEQGVPLAEGGQIVSISKLEAHQRGIRHLAVSVFIFSSQGHLLLQQRALTKYHSPGMWSNSCCTHPRMGESPLQAAERRLAQEMGISPAITQAYTCSYCVAVGDGLIENEFDHVFIGYSDLEPNINPEEAAGWRWISVPELEAEMRKNKSGYAVWFQILWPETKKYIKPG